MVNGHQIPFTPIAVDFWKIRESRSAKVFFLSHCHADHTEGLSSTWKKPIYCSDITAKIVKLKLNVDEKMLRPLELNCSHIIGLDCENSETMSVMLIDANHCPGATMFLFQGYFGNILYTGDFRFHVDRLTKTPLLESDIDTLYLDNTYCSPSCKFPSREQCVEKILNIIFESSDADSIVIGIRSLGKEELLVRIAQSVNEWIGVSETFYKMAEILSLPDVFTTDISNCRIKAQPLHMISSKKVKQWSEKQNTVVILPTAIYHGMQGMPFSNLENVHIVPYSDHSSYSELLQFVSMINPKRIIPIVSGRARGSMGMCVADRSDMSCFSQYMNSAKVHSFSIPASVKRFMSSGGCAVQCRSRNSAPSLVRSRRKQSIKSKLGVNYIDSPEKTKPALNITAAPLIVCSNEDVLGNKRKYDDMLDTKCEKDSVKQIMDMDISQKYKNCDLGTDLVYPGTGGKQMEEPSKGCDDTKGQVTVITLTIEDSESDPEGDQNGCEETLGKQSNNCQLYCDATDGDSVNSYVEQLPERVHHSHHVSSLKSTASHSFIELKTLNCGQKAVLEKSHPCEEYYVIPLHKKRRRRLMHTLIDHN